MQKENWKEKFGVETFEKIESVLQKEDLKEIYDLGNNKSIDQIKTINAVNASHNNFLNEIKNKSSNSSLKSVNDNASTEKHDDTMDLFS
jgi:hypothetical protein